MRNKSGFNEMIAAHKFGRSDDICRFVSSKKVVRQTLISPISLKMEKKMCEFYLFIFSRCFCLQGEYKVMKFSDFSVITWEQCCEVVHLVDKMEIQIENAIHIPRMPFNRLKLIRSKFYSKLSYHFCCGLHCIHAFIVCQSNGRIQREISKNGKRFINQLNILVRRWFENQFDI